MNDQVKMPAPYHYNEAQRFFFENAGYKFDPPETRMAGHMRWAEQAAADEAAMLDAGYNFEWDRDTSEQGTWMVTMYNSAGIKIRTEHRIDLGQGVTPKDGTPYTRVVKVRMYQWYMRGVESTN